MSLDTGSHYQIEVFDWDQAPETLRALRNQVFVQEQKVPAELEWDATDTIAEHFLVRDADGQGLAVARLYADAEGNGHIGRMAVAASERGTGLGQRLLRAVMAHGREQYARYILSAQEYAMGFYQRCGFVVYSDVYDDAGIPHRTMRCTAPGLILDHSSETDTPLHLGRDTSTWPLASNTDWSAALDTLTSQARRRLWLLEPLLDPERYDREFLRDLLSQLARRSRYSEIRLLIAHDKPLAERRHRLVELMRRLPSHIQLRMINTDYPVPDSAFAIADDSGVAFRHQASAPIGFCNFNAPGRVKPLAEQFQQLWNTARPSIELRDMPL